MLGNKKAKADRADRADRLNETHVCFAIGHTWKNDYKRAVDQYKEMNQALTVYLKNPYNELKIEECLWFQAIKVMEKRWPQIKEDYLLWKSLS